MISFGEDRSRIVGSINKLKLVALISMLLIVTLSLPQQSRAAFPGANGKIAFTSNRDGNWDIYRVNADGTGETKLTSWSDHDRDPAWSPDGSKIAFASIRSSPRQYDIYVINADGSGVVQLTNTLAHEGYPAWSPDGSRIAFHSDRDGNLEIYIMNPDGSNPTRLTFNAAEDSNPVWSPDGSKIAFISTRDGNSEIYVMNADGTDQIRLTYSVDDESTPDWSPDGTKIVFARSPSPGVWRDNDVFVMKTDGTGITQLASSVGTDDLPSWSPDGSKIAFTSSRDGSLQIYIMNPDGSNPTQLTYDAGSNEQSDWQPILKPQELDGPILDSGSTIVTKGSTNTWTLHYVISANVPLTKVKVQGGLASKMSVLKICVDSSCSGPITVPSTLTLAGTTVAVSLNKQNIVVRWAIASMTGGSSRTITITLQGTFKSSGIAYLTGSWSAECTSIIFGTTKTPYTNTLPVTVI